MKNYKAIIMLLGFVASLVLVYKGLRATGYTGLLLMFAGLAILLIELFVYNKQHQ